jgi:hypothetical protein
MCRGLSSLLTGARSRVAPIYCEKRLEEVTLQWKTDIKEYNAVETNGFEHAEHIFQTYEYNNSHK